MHCPSLRRFSPLRWPGRTTTASLEASPLITVMLAEGHSPEQLYPVTEVMGPTMGALLAAAVTAPFGHGAPALAVVEVVGPAVVEVVGPAVVEVVATARVVVVGDAEGLLEQPAKANAPSAPVANRSTDASRFMPGPLSEKGYQGWKTYSGCEHDRTCSSAETDAVGCFAMAELATESGAL